MAGGFIGHPPLAYFVAERKVTVVPIALELDSGLHQVLWEHEGAVIERSVLPGGVRLLTERDPSMRSASVGFWLPVGSRDEAAEHAGSTHFLEHLLFKGTPSRTALDIAQAFDEVGGESNAVTAKEHTCYYARVRSKDLPMAVATLADMVTSPLLDADAFVTEREVILEELAMAEDDPTDVGHEALVAGVLGPDTALGRPIGGTPATIRAVGLESVRAHYGAYYRPENLVVTAVGDVHHEELAQQITNELFAGGWSLTEGTAPNDRRPTVGFQFPSLLDEHRGTDALRTAGVTRALTRPTEQTHVFLGGPSLRAIDERRHGLSVLMSILGGGMSSRLFQEIREKRGLAYSVYGFSSGYRDAGLVGLYGACRTQHADTVASLMLDELDKLASNGVTPDELRRALGQITGSMALGLEDTQARMGRIASAELMHGVYRSVDEALGAFNQVTRTDLQQLAQDIAADISIRVDVGPEKLVAAA